MAADLTDPPEILSSNPFQQDITHKNRPSPAIGQILWRLVKEVVSTVTVASAIALALNFFIMQVTYVHGKSMEPNLHTNQRLMIEKLSYQFLAPQRGDVVVLNIEQSPQPLIKRVVGLPGEVIEINHNQLLIDGQPLDEPYLADIAQHDYGPVEIAPNHIFVLGDNRGVSHDSRFFGAVRVDTILGRAWLSYWPLESLGPVD